MHNPNWFRHYDARRREHIINNLVEHTRWRCKDEFYAYLKQEMLFLWKGKKKTSDLFPALFTFSPRITWHTHTKSERLFDHVIGYFRPLWEYQSRVDLFFAFTFFLNSLEHMVRKGLHDGDPVELRHLGDVPALHGWWVSDEQVQNIAGELTP